MGNGSEMEKATSRLNTALQTIEDAVASKRQSDLTNDSLMERVQSLEDNLKAEREQKEKLNETTSEVSRRIETAMASIEDILKGN